MAHQAAYIYTAPDHVSVEPGNIAPEHGSEIGLARNDPAALIKNLIGEIDRRTGPVELTRLPLADLGLEEAVDLAADRVGDQLDLGRFVLFLSGEHAVSLGAILAHARREKRFGVLLLTARTEANRKNHRRAETARRILEAGVRVVGVGDRAFSSPERSFWDRAEVTVVRPGQAARPDWPDRLIQTLPPKVYLSLDLDFGSRIPGQRSTVTASDPTRTAMPVSPIGRLIDRLFAVRRVIGADLIEPTSAGRLGPNLTAARIISRLNNGGVQ